MLLVRHMFYWPLPVDAKHYLIDWQTYPSYNELNIADALLKIQGYSRLSQKDKARFDFFNRYFNKMWFLFHLGNFYWEMPSTRGPYCKISL